MSDLVSADKLIDSLQATLDSLEKLTEEKKASGELPDAEAKAFMAGAAEVMLNVTIGMLSGSLLVQQ